MRTDAIPDDGDEQEPLSKSKRVDYNRSVFANVILLTAMLQPIGLAHLVAVAERLTPDASSQAVRRAVNHLLLDNVLASAQRPKGRWNSSLRQVITTGTFWGRYDDLDTHGVPRGPRLEEIAGDVLEGHLIGAHLLAASFVSGHHILADTAWIDAARQASTQRPRSALPSAELTEEETIAMQVPAHTCLGIITPNSRAILFGGFWSQKIEASTLERILSVTAPVELIHPGTGDCEWIHNDAERLKKQMVDTSALRVNQLCTWTPSELKRYHTETLELCRTSRPSDSAILERSERTLLAWRSGPSHSGASHP